VVQATAVGGPALRKGMLARLMEPHHDRPVGSAAIDGTVPAWSPVWVWP
jgi:hypothetical protein